MIDYSTRKTIQVQGKDWFYYASIFEDSVQHCFDTYSEGNLIPLGKVIIYNDGDFLVDCSVFAFKMGYNEETILDAFLKIGG